MKIVLLLIVPIFIFGQQKSAPKLADYEGYYIYSPEYSDSLSDGLQLDIVRGDDTSKTVIMIYLFADSLSNYFTENAAYEAEYFKLIKDSLYFRINNCSNECYDFSGRFLVPSTELGKRNENVLEGVISHFKRTKLVLKRKVIFQYSVGC